MTVEDRLVDADGLWSAGRREGGLLLAMVAVAAAARQANPGASDHRAFVAYLKSRHTWTIAVEFRDKSWDLDELFYAWLRCELVHAARLPVDIRIDDVLSGLEVRAGGPPDYVVLIAPDWFDFFVQAARRGIRVVNDHPPDGPKIERTFELATDAMWAVDRMRLRLRHLWGASIQSSTLVLAEEPVALPDVRRCPRGDLPGCGEV